MTKKWNTIVVMIIFVLVAFSVSTTTSQESAENRVGVKIALSYSYVTDQDSIKNVPLEWTLQWKFGIHNWRDDTHEPVINPQVTVKSSLGFIKFCPDDPDVFTAQQKLGMYTWNFGEYEISEYEFLSISAAETEEVILERPRFTVSRTVSPEVLKETNTLQRVTVAFRVEEPLPPEINYISIDIGLPQNSLVKYQVESQNEVKGWDSGYDPNNVGWSINVLPEVGRTYEFEATFKATKSSRLVGSPTFKPDVSVYCGNYQYQKQETSKSITVVYSDFISATFTVDNAVTWIPYTNNPIYAIRLIQVFSGIVGEEPPFNVKIDADIFASHEILDLSSTEKFAIYIRLPKGYDANDIDVNTILCNGAPAVKGTAFGEDNKGYKAEFNIEDLVDVPVSYATKLTVTGELVDGTQFEGITTVKIVNTQLEEFAEKTFEEAVAAFSSEDYEPAEQLFIQAQDTYRSISNFTKVSECQNYIDRCSQHLEEEQLKADKTEALFNEGVSCFEQGQYDMAKTKFEKALTLFTELDDEEKVKKCEEWIASCEKQLEEEGSRGFCVGSTMIMLLLLGGALQNLFIGRSDRKAKQ